MTSDSSYQIDGKIIPLDRVVDVSIEELRIVSLPILLLFVGAMVWSWGNLDRESAIGIIAVCGSLMLLISPFFLACGCQIERRRFGHFIQAIPYKKTSIRDRLESCLVPASSIQRPSLECFGLHHLGLHDHSQKTERKDRYGSS